MMMMMMMMTAGVLLVSGCLLEGCSKLRDQQQ